MTSAGATTHSAGRQSTERRPTLTAIDGSERHARASTADSVVAAAIAGDAGARSQLVRACLRKAMAIAIEYMSTREDAEDVVQDAFRSAFANLHRFDHGRPFEPWFFTIVRNTARNAIDRRRIRTHEALSPAIATPEATPLDNARRRELRGAIDQAIGRLPPAQQTCFRLCVVEGLTSAEAASATGVAESTVRVHIFKARRALQELLERWRDEVG